MGAATAAADPPWRRPLLLLLALAASVRAVYLLEYASLPFLEAPLFDSPIYLRQAAAVRAGDLSHPTLLALSPLYGYVLALCERLILPLQLGLGLLNIALVYQLARTLFDEASGFFSAVLFAGYGFMVFYESKLMAETVGLSLLLAACCVYANRRFQGGHAGLGLAAGALLGLATLARANLLFSAVLACAAAPLLRPALAISTPRRAAAQRTLWLTAGLAIVLGAHGLGHYQRTGLFVPVILTSNTVATATQTSAGWTGDFRVFSRDGEGVSPWDVVRQAEQRLAGVQAPAQERPGIDWWGYLRGAPQKAWLTLRDVETGHDYGYYGERSEVRSLALVSLSFGGLLLLAVIGVGFAVRTGHAGQLWVLAPVVLGTFATTTLFHPSSRYRVAIVIALVCLGGFAVSRLRRWQGRWRWPVIAVTGAAVAALALRTATYSLAHPGMWELRVAEAEILRGDLDATRERVARALRQEGGDPAIERRIAYLESLAGRPLRP